MHLELIEEPITGILRMSPDVKNNLNLFEVGSFHKPKSKTKDKVVLVLTAAIVQDDGQLLAGTPILLHPTKLSKGFNDERCDVVAALAPFIFGVTIC
jgi:hypothetical protein